jgi:hypothetical protein
VNELLVYLCFGAAAFLAPLCCYLHAVSPDAMRIRHVGNISVFLGWFLLFLGAVFADMGTGHEYKWIVAFLGVMPALASFILWFVSFWIWSKITGRTWPTHFPDDPVIRRRRRW